MDQIVILLAEDREGDITLVQRAFERAGIGNPLMIVRDGEEAINYLSGAGRYSNRTLYPRPGLLLLDLTLPLVDGFEVLHWIKSQPGLKNLLVIVLTASDRIRDASQAYRLGAHSFLVKSVDFQDAAALAGAVTHYLLKSKNHPLIEIPPEQWPSNTIFERSPFNTSELPIDPSNNAET